MVGDWLDMFDAVGTDSFRNKLYSASERWGLVVKKGLFQIDLLKHMEKHERLHMDDMISNLQQMEGICLQRTWSFCCERVVEGPLSSADVGVILRIKPPLLDVLPATKAARSLRNSPAKWMV